MVRLRSTGFPFRASLLALAAFAVLATPAAAQDGLAMRSLLGNLGLLPQEKDPIEYRERPSLVVPKDVNKLRQPEDAATARNNGQWPVDPDVVAREQEREKRNQPLFVPRNHPTEGHRLSVQEMAKGRVARGTELGEWRAPRNDKDGVVLSIHEMNAAGKSGSVPTYPPGTEPPRRYLTDPPVGTRAPSTTAPVGRYTMEGPLVTGNGSRPDGLWRGKNQ